jgi:N-acetyl-anhydromuramyl-L-alanine amidase AmpD
MNIIEKTYKLNGDLRTRSKTTRIILHHAAATNCTVEDIDRWHKNNGWTCIGYHFFVNKKGEVYRGRKENTVGAHAGDNNTDSLGVCAEGNFEKETMPEAQKEALKELVAYLKNKYGISKVQKHRDVNATACPGKNYPFDEIANAKPIESKPVETKPTAKKKTVDEIAKEVIAGKWGNGDERYNKLTKAGYNYNEVQSKVNEILLGKPSKPASKPVSKPKGKSVDELAKEVIAGKWGNGNERYEKLTKAGYDYNTVQKRVNQLLK